MNRHHWALVTGLLYMALLLPAVVGDLRDGTDTATVALLSWLTVGAMLIAIVEVIGWAASRIRGRRKK